MTILDRFNIGLVGAVAGLCGVAVGVGPSAAAAPFTTGGYDCVAPAPGGAAPAAGGLPVCAPVADMAGIPMGLPGPPPVAPPPVAPPIVPPIAPPPIVPPIAPPIVPAAPLAPVVGGMGGLDTAGGYGGKGDPILPPAPGAPAAGQPILPGPAPRDAS